MEKKKKGKKTLKEKNLNKTPQTTFTNCSSKKQYY